MKMYFVSEAQSSRTQPGGLVAGNYTLGIKMQQLPESKNTLMKVLASIHEKMKDGIIKINQD